jgi:indolepyruvate ferredoxin oxidoreductase beta subunit
MRAYLQQHVADLTLVPAEKALLELGSPKVLNLLLLGYASANLGLSEDSLLTAIRENVPPKFLDLNLKAFSYFK